MSSLDHSRLEGRVYGSQAIDLVGSRSVEAFTADVAVRLGVLHCLTLIGEAANQVSAETRHALPAVPWSNVVGLRHVIVHHYRKVDLGQIWTIVTRDFAAFVEVIRDFLKDEP